MTSRAPQATPQRDPEELAALARLARLQLDATAAAPLSAQLGAVIGYIDQLLAVDVGGVAPWSPDTPAGAPLREDVAGAALERDEVLAGAPASADGLVTVPRFVES